MGMLAAFLVGYWMGTRAGEDGMRKLAAAGLAVVQSDEFKTVVAGAGGMARNLVGQAIAAAVSPPEPTRLHAA